MAENLIFNYLSANDVLPEQNNGNIYFRLISNNNNNEKIYGQDHSFEVAVDLDNRRYFITPKLSSNSINGLLSLIDKQKIDSLPYGESIITKNLFTENNVSINIDNAEDAQTYGDLIVDENNKIKLNLNIAASEIKGKDGSNGSDGINGINGITPQIEEGVNITIDSSDKEKTPVASFKKTDQESNIYKLSLDFPKLQGEDGEKGDKGDSGLPAIINNVNVALLSGDENPSGEAIPIEGSNNAWDILINLPKEQLRGPQGYTGPKGDTGSLQNFSIQYNQNGNIVSNIETVANENGKLDSLNISRHFSPILQEETIENQSSAYSILYKTNTDFTNYEYSILTPSEGILCYHNDQLQYTPILPIEYGGIGQNSLDNGILIKTNEGIESKEISSSNSILITSNNSIADIESTPGAFYSNGGLPIYDTLPVSYGGTGQTSFSKNSILLGDDENGINKVDNLEGAFFSNGEDAPQFGILPISLGGTQSETKFGARHNLQATHAKLVNSITNKLPVSISDIPSSGKDYKLVLGNTIIAYNENAEEGIAKYTIGTDFESDD